MSWRTTVIASNMKALNLSYLSDLSDDDKILLNKIAQWAFDSQKKFLRKFTFFLDSRQVALCESVLKSIGFENYNFFGGYTNSEKVVLGIFSDYSDVDPCDYPIVPLTFTYRKQDLLTHRDFLGALMSQKVSRECVGDIIVEQGKTVVFLYETIADYIQHNIVKIGRVGVKTSLKFDEEIVPVKKFDEINGTVASLRLDCVLSLAIKLSRVKAAALIKSSGVEVNYFPVYSANYTLNEGDEFSIRGYGKFIFESKGSFSKKERIHIKLLKYV